jgi:hypothetical protein
MNNNYFLLKLSSSYNFSSIFLKNFLKEIRPLGECREGRFSEIETDIPFTGEITSDDGWSYDQYDYSFKNGVKFLSYQSCTGSKVIITNFLNSCEIKGENIGNNTLKAICNAAKETFLEINKISEKLIRHHFSEIFNEFVKLEEMIEEDQ